MRITSATADRRTTASSRQSVSRADWDDVNDLFSVHVLGPIRARVDGSPAELGRGLRPRLLSWLALHQGTAVTVERTVEAMWPDSDAAIGRSRLAGLIWSTRGAVSPADLGVTRDQARLFVTLTPEQVDACVFQAAVRHAQGSMFQSPHRTVKALSGSLALWRGDPYPELAHDPDGIAEAVRLTILRLDALEHLHGLQILLGPPPGLAAEISAVVGADPTRETSWRQLMAVLQATDRHVEALRVFHECRRTLLDHGLTPSSGTRAVEQAVIEGRLPDAPLLLPDQRRKPAERPAPASWETDLIRRWRADPGGLLVIVETPDVAAVRTPSRHLQNACPPGAPWVFVIYQDGPSDENLPGAEQATPAALGRVASLARRLPVLVVIEQAAAPVGDDPLADRLPALVSGGGDLLVVVVTSGRAKSSRLRASAGEILYVNSHG